MHIVGINIGQAAAPSGLPLVRVVFEGRGVNLSRSKWREATTPTARWGQSTVQKPCLFRPRPSKCLSIELAVSIGHRNPAMSAAGRAMSKRSNIATATNLARFRLP